mmetsp:Transcript_42617/g.70915  ORF Transcript_42617/g.70915 Transcript_42617/m.70915 type:complete len:509 (-) Transcript_42617:5258-6784(-)
MHIAHVHGVDAKGLVPHADEGCFEGDGHGGAYGQGKAARKGEAGGADGEVNRHLQANADLCSIDDQLQLSSLEVHPGEGELAHDYGQDEGAPRDGNNPEVSIGFENVVVQKTAHTILRQALANTSNELEALVGQTSRVGHGGDDGGSPKGATAGAAMVQKLYLRTTEVQFCTIRNVKHALVFDRKREAGCTRYAKDASNRLEDVGGRHGDTEGEALLSAPCCVYGLHRLKDTVKSRGSATEAEDFASRSVRKAHHQILEPKAQDPTDKGPDGVEFDGPAKPQAREHVTYCDEGRRAFEVVGSVRAGLQLESHGCRAQDEVKADVELIVVGAVGVALEGEAWNGARLRQLIKGHFLHIGRKSDDGLVQIGNAVHSLPRQFKDRSRLLQHRLEPGCAKDRIDVDCCAPQALREGSNIGGGAGLEETPSSPRRRQGGIRNGNIGDCVSASWRGFYEYLGSHWRNDVDGNRAVYVECSGAQAERHRQLNANGHVGESVVVFHKVEGARDPSL